MKIFSAKSKILGLLLASSLLASCNGVLDSSVPKHKREVPEYLTKAMKTKGMAPKAPILLRIFKEENVVEVWKKSHTGRFALLHTYEICKWSGKLGPKFKEGDRQAPEGFYHVTPSLMNPNSQYHLSFNMGFPNTYDRANGRTGSHLMIHGACSSAGCYSMTDQYAEEIYSLAREAFSGGQRRFQIQAYPFRMTAENMARHTGDPNFEFWRMLKEGSDHFEVSRLPPKVDYCEKRYVFNRSAEEGQGFQSREICPPAKISQNLATAFFAKQNSDQKAFDAILTKAIKNPLVKPEDKPKVTSASILAQPTKGPLTVFTPKPVAVPAKKEVPIEEAKPAAATQTPASVAPVTTNNDGINRVANSTDVPGTTLKLPDPVEVPKAAGN